MYYESQWAMVHIKYTRVMQAGRQAGKCARAHIHIYIHRVKSLLLTKLSPGKHIHSCSPSIPRFTLVKERKKRRDELTFFQVILGEHVLAIAKIPSNLESVSAVASAC